MVLLQGGFGASAGFPWQEEADFGAAAEPG